MLCTRAYPGVSQDVFHVIAVRAYLDALSPDLRRRVGDHEPKTLDDAMRKALVLETQDLAEESRTHVSGPLIAATKPDISPLDALTKAFDRLEASQSATASALTKLCDSFAQCTSHSSPPSRSYSFKGGKGSDARGGTGTNLRASGIRCFLCKGIGHMRRDCPSNQDKSLNA